MHLHCLTAFTLIAAGLLHPLLSLAADELEPSPGESIADFIAADIASGSDDSTPTTSPDDNPGTLSNDPANTSDTAELIGRKVHLWKAPALVARKPLLYQPSKANLVATYKSSDGGYNITFPGSYPADTSIGDWESPSGEIVKNATLAQMWQKLKLPPAMLVNYTASRTHAAFEQYDAILSSAICDVSKGPDRELLDDDSVAKYRFDPKALSGYFATTIVCCAGSWGITVNGIFWAIDHHGWTANITLWEQAEIIAATATVDLLFLRIMGKLQERGYMSHVEAFVLNMFIIAGERIGTGVGFAVKGVCTTSAQVRKGMISWSASVKLSGVMFTANPQGEAMRTAGLSSVNLVSQGGRSSGEGQCRTPP